MGNQKSQILAAVEQDWHALEHADPSMKKDRDVVLAAVKQNEAALKYADESLKKALIGSSLLKLALS